MPTYQYACTECDHRFEAVQAFSDPTLTECPQCRGRLRKVYGSVGVVFKGSGFYRTDSRSGANKASLAPEHKSDKADGTTTEKTHSTPGGEKKSATKHDAPARAAANRTAVPAHAAG